MIDSLFHRAKRLLGLNPYSTRFDGRVMQIKDVRLLRSAGLKVIREETLSIDQVYMAYMLEIDDRFLDFFKDPETGEATPESRGIRFTPHFRLLREVLEKGREAVWEKIDETDYFQYRMRFGEVGYKLNLLKPGERHELKVTPVEVRERTGAFLDLFDEIRARGFLGPGFEFCQPLVLEDAFVKTRHGVFVKGGPYEVWSGHHRLACLAALGGASATFPAVILRDA